MQCARHIILISLTAALIHMASGWWLLPAMLAHGIALVALFAPLHEGSHRTVFQTRWPNHVIAWVAGLVLVLPPTWFRQFHLAHHRHTQDPARDPELTAPKPRSLGQYLWVASGIPFWRDAVCNLPRLALGRFAGMDYLVTRERPAATRDARIFIGIYAALAIAGVVFSSTAALVYWLIPILLGQPVLRLFLLAEHTACAETADGLTNTRTTLTSAPVRWLMWNMSYHAEHHLYPSVPFHALPLLHSDIRKHLRMVAPSYSAAHRDIRSGLSRR